MTVVGEGLIQHALPIAGAVGVPSMVGILSVIFAEADGLDTGIVVGAAGLLLFLFRYWFQENKRNTDETWNHADEYRVERDFHRAEAQYWQARWLSTVQTGVEVPPIPNFELMKAEALDEKETARGRRR